MKIHNICNHLQVALKRSALALALGAAVTFGASPSAHANLTYTFVDLGNPPPNEVIIPNKEGWTLIHSAAWAKYVWWGSDGNIGDGWSTAEAQLAQSPAFKLNGSGPMTWQIIGIPASPAPYPVSAAGVQAFQSASIPAAAIVGGGFMGMALREVDSDTYVLWKPIPVMTGPEIDALGPPPGGTSAPWPTLSFTQAELAPYANNGKAYTLDFIDNNKSPNANDHWSTLGGASIPGNPVSVLKTYEFNDGTLQGWNNRVWNEATSAWVDLAPDLETMPGTVNGGVIQPPSADNNLLANNGTKVEPIGGNIDNHLNSHWLRSPVFKLAPYKDLTAQIGGGESGGTAPEDDAFVPSAAETGGWKGIALRRVSDGVFVRTKSSSSQDTALQTVTFTAGELAEYVGLDYTLELINLDNDSPGWVSMDNVSIPVPPSNAADMLTFGTGGVITGTSVSLFVPFGTNLATLAPACTVSPFASYTGPTPLFSVANPSSYVVTAEDGTTKTYTVTINFGTPSPACDILTFVFPGQLDTVISGTNISVTVPLSTTVTALAPTYTTSAFANGSPVSGTPRNFSSPQSYTITAQDGSATKTYTVTVTKGQVPSVFTWNTPAAGNWSESAKWTNDLATGSKPATSGAAFYTLNFTQAGTYTATNDLSDGFALNQLNFAGAVTLAGTNGLALTTNGATLPTINQNSTNGITISPPVSLTAPTTLSGTGNGQVILGGLVSGPGSLVKSNSGALVIYAVASNGAGGYTSVPNTYSGGTTITAGTLQFGTVFGAGITPPCIEPAGTGPITLSSGATISFNRVSASNALTVNGGLIANYNGWNSSWNGPITLNATVTTENVGDTSFTSVISGVGGITKAGNGKLFLSAANTYNGDSTVNAGTLLVNGNAIKDTTKLVINGGKVEATGTETVNTLFFGAVQQVAGTWGATGSGATNIDNVRFSGTTGVVNVLTGSANDYATWATSYLPANVSLPTGDSDGDGMSNLQEYAFGLNPTSGASANPITSPLNKTTGKFSYTRRATPALTGMTYTVLTSNNLVTWTTDTGAVAESVVTAGDIQTVTFTVANPAVNGQLFVRVRAVQ
jgi:autotransporter-associated beta strand protein